MQNIKHEMENISHCCLKIYFLKNLTLRLFLIISTFNILRLPNVSGNWKDHKNTTRVDLPEVDFSFHEDNHKIKEMTEVTSRDHEASFIESYHPPRFMSRKFIEVNGNEGGHGKPWAVISLTLWLSSWREKSTSGKSTLVVFLYSISDNPPSKNNWRLERYKSGWMQINCYI